MDSNEKSQFQARELKSVYVDSVTLLLKIVFHKCYANKFNLYNQVGLIALNCMGEMHAAGSPGRRSMAVGQGVLPAGMGTTGTGAGLGGTGVGLGEEELLCMDRTTLETLKALFSAKERAISMEDFDEAKRLKETIERLKMMSGHISQLEERK